MRRFFLIYSISDEICITKKKWTNEERATCNQRMARVKNVNNSITPERTIGNTMKKKNHVTKEGRIKNMEFIDINIRDVLES